MLASLYLFALEVGSWEKFDRILSVANLGALIAVIAVLLMIRGDLSGKKDS